ncbi:MAG: hypothetical protein AABX40_01100 [Candidatus Hydrothermarchaeota archaeon]
MEKGNESIHIKISSRFETFYLLPFTIAEIDSKCILEIENVGETKLPKMDFRWKIESEMIKIGKEEKLTRIYYNIYNIELEPGKKIEKTLPIRPFIPGHHKLIVGIPDSEKGGHFIIGELGEKEVAGKSEQKWIRFQADPEMDFEGPWYTYFEVYSWYLLAIGLGTFSAFVLVIIEILKAIF